MSRKYKPEKTRALRPEFECRERIAERVAVLVDTFGKDDSRVHKVKNRLLELCDLVEGATPANWQIASMYAAWATKNPEEITRQVTYDCTCGAGNGWVIETDESGRIGDLRPCSRCNQEVFSYLYEKGNIKMDGPVTGAPTASLHLVPPIEEPPWDNL